MPIMVSLIKAFHRVWDIFITLLRKPFIGNIGKGSFIKSGVKIIGNPYNVSVGQKFKIWENCIIAVGRGKIKFGNNGLLGVGSYMNAGENEIIIGDNVAIAPFCKFFAYSHHYSIDSLSVDSYIKGDIIIESNVLIGCGSIILPNVRIGFGSVVAANSVVNKDVPPYTIVGGTPAKIIKTIENRNN